MISADVKDKILSLARERIFIGGSTKFSVDELTSELSMSKKTFYQVFESKDDLIETIVERQMSEINTNMENILARPVGFVQKLHAIVSFMGGVLGRMSKAAFVELHHHHPHLWKRIENFRRERLTKTITRLIEQGMTEGYVSKGINPRVFVLAYLAAIEGVIQGSVLSQESFSSPEALNAIMAIFFKGILTDNARIEYAELQDSNTQNTS